MKILYCICILFFMNCIISLIEESYEVSYILGDENEKIFRQPIEASQYLACINLNRIYPNETKIGLNKLDEKLRKYYYELKSKGEIYESEKRYDKSFVNKFEEDILNQNRSKNYL